MFIKIKVRRGIAHIAVFNMGAHGSIFPHADILVNFRTDSEVPVSQLWAGPCKAAFKRRENN